MSNQEQGWVQAGTTFTPETIFRGPSSRRRISRGSMSVTGSEPGNPEELVDEQEELIQAAIEAQHVRRVRLVESHIHAASTAAACRSTLCCWAAKRGRRDRR